MSPLSQESQKNYTDLLKAQLNEIKSIFANQYLSISSEIRQIKQSLRQLIPNLLQFSNTQNASLVKQLKGILMDPQTWRKTKLFEKRIIKCIKHEGQNNQDIFTLNGDNSEQQEKIQKLQTKILQGDDQCKKQVQISQIFKSNKSRPNKLMLQKKQQQFYQEQSTQIQKRLQRSKTPDTPRFKQERAKSQPRKLAAQIQTAKKEQDQKIIERLIFSNSLLLNQSQKKSVQNKLKQSEVNYTGHSELLYKFSDKNMYQNLHHYIDNRKNTLLVIKLKNQKVLCGFTQIGFKKRNMPQNNPRAWIADLTRDKYYVPKNTCKTICYDENFLLFGNSEIRLKNKDYKMYSNFGISKGFFATDGDKITDFIGTENLLSNRQAQFIDYQIYRLF